MKIIILRKLVFFTVLLISTNVMAKYCALGKLQANVCSGFILESCKFIQVDAIREGDSLFEIKRCFNDVDEYNHEKQRCWKKTKSNGDGVFSWGINYFLQPDFLHESAEGKYEEVDAEYITFKCKHLR